eukprot:3103231-Rhodomonas_salina.3
MQIAPDCRRHRAVTESPGSAYARSVPDTAQHLRRLLVPGRLWTTCRYRCIPRAPGRSIDAVSTRFHSERVGR